MLPGRAGVNDNTNEKHSHLQFARKYPPPAFPAAPGASQGAPDFGRRPKCPLLHGGIKWEVFRSENGIILRSDSSLRLPLPSCRPPEYNPTRYLPAS
jgi:hypothetical protein